MRYKGELTKQAIFDFVVNHLMNMESQSSSTRGGCFYRGQHNNMCAVGCLIDDETAKRWDENEESTGFDDIIKSFPNDPSVIKLLPFKDLLVSLQSAHDYKVHWDNNKEHMKEELISIAKRFNLNYDKEKLS